MHPLKANSSGSASQIVKSALIWELGPPIFGNSHMGGCQNYGPFLGPYYNTAPII